jgi:hypothetical protein
MRLWTLIPLLSWTLALPVHQEGHDHPVHPLPPPVSHYYAAIDLNQDLVLAGGVRLLGNSPWLPFLAPGMSVDARGYWQGEDFVVTSLSILSPLPFTYYQGPGALLGLKGWVQVWFDLQRGIPQIFALYNLSQPKEIQLLTYAGPQGPEAWPSKLPRPTQPLPQGWVELRGILQGQDLKFVAVSPFPSS